MPTYTPAHLARAQLGASYATLYTAASNTILKEVVVTNVTGSSVTLDLSLVPAGGSASLANAVVNNAVIAPYATVIFTFSQVLTIGAFVSAKASVAAALTMTMSGVTFGEVAVIPARLGWHVRRVANQSVNADASTDVQWDTEVEDVPGNFTPPSTTLTVPAGGGGLWAVTFTVVAGSAMGSMGLMWLIVNAGGMSFQSSDNDDVTNPLAAGWTLSLPNLPLAAGDTVVCTVRHSATAAVNFTGRLLAYKVGV